MRPEHTAPLLCRHEAEAHACSGRQGHQGGAHLEGLYRLRVQEVAAGGIKGLQVLRGVRGGVKVQAQLGARGQAEPGQAKPGGHGDADAGGADGERCQVPQLVPCRQPAVRSLSFSTASASDADKPQDVAVP